MKLLKIDFLKDAIFMFWFYLPPKKITFSKKESKKKNHKKKKNFSALFLPADSVEATNFQENFCWYTLNVSSSPPQLMCEGSKLQHDVVSLKGCKPWGGAIMH